MSQPGKVTPEVAYTQLQQNASNVAGLISALKGVLDVSKQIQLVKGDDYAEYSALIEQMYQISLALCASFTMKLEQQGHSENGRGPIPLARPNGA